MTISFEGCVISEMGFGDFDRILDIFNEEGLFGFIEKYGRAKSSLGPFQIVNGVRVEGRGSLNKLKDAKVVKHFLNLRGDFKTIEAAAKMGSAIKKTQLPNKDAKDLYILFTRYLERLEMNPDAYLVSFWLKLLVHEGVWEYGLMNGFDEEGKKLIEILMLARERSIIESVEVDSVFVEGVEKLFFDSISA
jgi:DNA repair protein RecO